MSTLPTGTVTFHFTDIEGSTTRWEHDRVAMEASIEGWKEITDTAREKLGEEIWHQSEAEGRAMSLEDAIAYVLEEPCSGAAVR